MIFKCFNSQPHAGGDINVYGHGEVILHTSCF